MRNQQQLGAEIRQWENELAQLQKEQNDTEDSEDKEALEGRIRELRSHILRAKEELQRLNASQKETVTPVRKPSFDRALHNINKKGRT